MSNSYELYLSKLNTKKNLINQTYRDIDLFAKKHGLTMNQVSYAGILEIHLVYRDSKEVLKSPMAHKLQGSKVYKIQTNGCNLRIRVSHI